MNFENLMGNLDASLPARVFPTESRASEEKLAPKVITNGPTI
jgi:hypothetical protein